MKKNREEPQNHYHASIRNPCLVEKENDETAITIIRGLDLLRQYAASAGLGVAVNTLVTAKEDIAYWAAEQDFNQPTLRGSAHGQINGYMLMLFEMLTNHFSHSRAQ